MPALPKIDLGQMLYRGRIGHVGRPDARLPEACSLGSGQAAQLLQRGSPPATIDGRFPKLYPKLQQLVFVKQSSGHPNPVRLDRRPAKSPTDAQYNFQRTKQAQKL